MAKLSERLHAQAEYPATDYMHETGCPSTTDARHIGLTCQELRARLIADRPKAIPVPPRRVIHVRTQDMLHKRNVAALARVGGFAYTHGGVNP